MAIKYITSIFKKILQTQYIAFKKPNLKKCMTYNYSKNINLLINIKYFTIFSYLPYI